MRKLYGILAYLLAFLISATVMGVVLWLSKGWFAFVILLVLLLLVGVFLMRSGIEQVLTVKETVIHQIQNDEEITFDRYALIASYLRIFLPMWLLFFLVPLVPGTGAWLLVLPPILLIVVIALKTTEHTWLTVGWRKRTYWLLHLAAIAVMVVSGVGIRFLIY